jgi:hypothetical protein
MVPKKISSAAQSCGLIDLKSNLHVVEFEWDFCWGLLLQASCCFQRFCTEFGKLEQIPGLSREQCELSEIESIASGEGEIPIPSSVEAPKKKRRMSAAARARIAAGARARWVTVKGTSVTASEPTKKEKRRLSAAGRAASIAGTKARWARVKRNTATPKSL